MSRQQGLPFKLPHLGLRRRFMLYTTLLASAIVLLLLVVSWQGTQAIVSVQEDEHLAQRARSIAAPIERMLELVHHELRSLSRQTLIANALLDSYGREAYLRPMLGEHRMPVEFDYNLTLADFVGRPLASRTAAVSYREAAWYAAMIASGKPYAGIEKSDSGAVLVVATPILIRYSRTYEGAVVFEANLSAWLGGAKSPIAADSRLDHVAIKAGDKLTVYERGQHAPGYVFRESPIASGTLPLSTALKVHVAVDAASFAAPARALILRHLLWGIIAIALVVIASDLLARALTRRIELLALEMGNIAHTGAARGELTATQFGNDEIGELASGMAALLQDLKAQQAGLETQVALRTAELLESESDLKLAQSVAQIGSWRIDLATFALRWSAETYRLFGIAENTPIDVQAFLACIHPDDRTLVERSLIDLQEDKRSIVEYRIVVDGALRWLRQQAVINPAGDGSSRGAIGTVQDISERRHAEAQLRQLSTAVEQSPASVVIADGNGIVEYVNPQFERMTGYTATEAHGRSQRDFLPAALQGEGYDALWAYVSSGGVWRGEYASQRKDGADYWEQITVSPVFTAVGEVSACLSLREDISLRKAQEAELRIAAAAFEAQESMVVTDAEGFILRVNQAFVDLFGYGAAEAIGQKMNLIRSARQDAAFFSAMWAQVQREGYWEGEIYNRRKDGKVFPVWLTLSSVRDELQNITHYVGTHKDISQRKAAEEEILRSNADLEQFAYAASHDMRQPLRMISSYLQLIAMELQPSLTEQTRQYLFFATEGAQRMDKMLAALLDYSRVGRKGEEIKMLDSRAVLDEALHFLRPLIAECDADLRIAGEWPPLFANHDELLRLLQNLLENALKYRQAGRRPEVLVSVAPDENMSSHEWRFSVRDNGIGLAAGHEKRLFKVFERLQSRSRYPGTGIGLALCRKIVEHHYGRIWAESAGEDQGSNFVFTLPKADHFVATNGNDSERRIEAPSDAAV